MPVVDVIIPAYNEEKSIARVIGDIDKNLVREVVVVDNNSKDQTARVAQAAGATVLREMKQGYGAACLKGIEYIKSKPSPPDVIVFLDADYSDHPEEMKQLIEPITSDDVDLVIGSRALGNRDRGSMTLPQVFGNWLATRMVRWKKLLGLRMSDQTYGWTVEMQLKAAKQKLKCSEVPVSYRKRIGVSKISGTVKGTLMAGYKIIATIIKYA
jgi:glycosyltransferase involved in cell wall biosynthesis